MIPLTLRRDRRGRPAATCHGATDRRASRRRRRAGRHRLARGRAGQPVRRPRRRARRRPRLRRRARGGRCGGRARRPAAGRACPPSSSTTSQTALRRGSPGRVRRPHARTSPVVGVTGSSGKTSTKDLLAAVLARARARRSPPTGSLNNEIGVPLTVAADHADTRYLVVEMGARGVGHIAYLTRIAPPRSASCSTSAPPTWASSARREAIARAKAELVEALPADGRRRPQRRRPAGGRDGRRHRRPRVVTRRHDRVRRRARRRTSAATTRAGRRSTLAGAAGRAPPVPAAAARRAPRRATPSPPRPSRSRLGMPVDAGRRGAGRGDAAQPLADGGHRARRRRHRRQRRLQRQPRLDAGRAQGARRHGAAARRTLGGARRDARARRRRR